MPAMVRYHTFVATMGLSLSLIRLKTGSSRRRSKQSTSRHEAHGKMGISNPFTTNWGMSALNRELFVTLRETRVILERWRMGYNGECPHSLLGYLSPSEYADRWGPRDPKSSAARRGRRSGENGRGYRSSAAFTPNKLQTSGLISATFGGGLGGVQYDGCTIEMQETAGDFQHRSRQPVYIARVDGKVGKSGPQGEHGRKRALD